jgi:nicotinamide-nucleotide amidase
MLKSSELTVKVYNLSIKTFHNLISDNTYLASYKWYIETHFDGTYLTTTLMSDKTAVTEKSNLIKQLNESLPPNSIYGFDNDTLVSIIDEWFKKNGKTLSTAESCTGGLLSKLLTDMPGASSYFLGGFVTYSNELKMKSLRVGEDLLIQYGAVSKEVAKEMAVGCIKQTNSHYAISITGVAGPTGGTKEKPVGLVYMGIADDQFNVLVDSKVFAGNRNDIRCQAVYYVLNVLRKKLSISLTI